MTKLNILFATSEAVPFAKTGGLADVSGMLPGKIAELGHSVKVALPYYGTIPPILMKSAKEGISLSLDIGNNTQPLQLTRLRDNQKDLEYLFIGNDFFFDRPELYRDNTTGKDYIDNDDRFIFFCRAIMELLPEIDFRPDIIHANDWQAALIPSFLKTSYGDNDFYSNTGTVLTIHNLAYQGLFPAKTSKKLGLDEKYFKPLQPFEFWEKVNFLKAAISFSDVINTVSEKYAEEIQTSNEYGAGLEGVLLHRKNDLFGIVNGVDYNEWSPQKDSLIPCKYSAKNFSGKRINKIELINRAKLPFRENVPLIGMISRLADQKGFDLLEEASSELLELDLQIIIIGTGEKKYHTLLTELEKKYPDKLKVFLNYSNEVAHWIEAGSDMFLMPSKYEPCGLNQLYSLKYGTVPIVRATGGLADTIDNVDFDTSQGTGYVFEEYDSDAMLKTIKRAVKDFTRKRKWRRIMKNGMEADYSWDASAGKYIELYRKALSKK